jgi:hypothetical protein
MSIETSPTPPSNARSADSIQSQLRGQQTVILGLTASLLLLAGSLAVSLWGQTSFIKTQLTEQQPAVRELLETYQKTSEPLIRDFFIKLQAFAVQHKDFQPILSKYMAPGSLPSASTQPQAPPAPAR